MKISHADSSVTTKITLLACLSVFALVGFLATTASAEENELAEVETTDVEVEEETLADEETNNSDAVSEKRAAMLMQIEELRKLVAERKAQLQGQREERVEERKESVQEWQENHAANRAEFFASLEGLTPEEKKVAMLEYIAGLKEIIAAKKAEMEAQRAQFQESREEVIQEREANQEEFRATLKGMSLEEKREAIMARVQQLQQILRDRLEDSENDESAEGEAEEEMEDEDEAEEADAATDDDESDEDEEDDL